MRDLLCLLMAHWRQHIESNSILNKWRNSLENKQKKECSWVKFLCQGQVVSALGEQALGEASAEALGQEGSLGGQGREEDARGLWERGGGSLQMMHAQKDTRGRRERKHPRSSGESSAEG